MELQGKSYELKGNEPILLNDPQTVWIIKSGSMDNAIPDSDKNLLLQIGVGLLVSTFATTLFRLVQGFTMLRVETISDVSAQAAVWDRLLRLPVSFFRQYTTGDLHNRVLSINNIRRQLSGTSLVNILTGFFALFYLGQLFYEIYMHNALSFRGVGCVKAITIFKQNEKSSALTHHL